MIVKPAKPGLIIRDPKTKRALPDEGARVPDTSFWLRRLRSGDVVVVEEPGKKARTNETKVVSRTPKERGDA